MKKIIITGIILTTCVSLCAAVWPRRVEVEDLPAEPIKPAVAAKIEEASAEVSQLFLSTENNASKPESITEIEPIKQATPDTVNSPESSQTDKSPSKPIPPPTPVSTEPKPGTIAVIDGVKSMWIPGFG